MVRIFLIASVLVSALGAEPVSVDVWPAKPPGETSAVGAEKLSTRMLNGKSIKIIDNVGRPTLTLFPAQRALSVVRARVREWHIDPQRLGILGFSAGGHLTAAAATNFDQRAYEPIDETDKTSCRPDFAVLVYPAYLVGKDGQLSPEIRV